MTPKMLEDWAKLNNMTIPDALKYLEHKLSTDPKKQKGPFAEGPISNISYDEF